MDLSKKQINKIKKHLLGKPLSTPRIMKKKKDICFYCGEVINKRKRQFIQVIKRQELAWVDCPSIYFHEECWLLAAGKGFEIK